MSATDHTRQYSAADIQRYLEGKMLPAEMHALEKAAQDDPFLADAIEGMQELLAQHDASLMDTHLQHISQQVYERTRKESRQAPVFAFRWWQAAAAAVIVITGGIWGYNYFRQTENPASVQNQLAIVKQETNHDSAAPAVAADAVITTAADTVMTAPKNDAVAAKASSLTKEEKALLALKERSATQQATSAAEQPAAVHDNLAFDRQKRNIKSSSHADAPPIVVGYGTVKKTDSLRNRLPDNKSNLLKDRAQSVAVTPAKPIDFEEIVIARQVGDTGTLAYTKPRERAMNTSRKELSNRQAKKNPNALLSGFISGRVTDQSNNPLSNALLRVDGNREFFTDHKGNFKIPVKDSVVNVAVGVTGYYTQNLQLLNNTNDNNIALNQLGLKTPNPQLNESTQIRIRGIDAGHEAKFKQESNTNYPEIRVQDAQPVDGWLEYQQYLEKNRNIPSGSPELTGTVVVSFQVNRKGALSDFKIEQSLGKVYDEEAIRLIKAGPSWKLLKGRKAKATVLVRF